MIFAANSICVFKASAVTIAPRMSKVPMSFEAWVISLFFSPMTCWARINSLSASMMFKTYGECWEESREALIACPSTAITGWDSLLRSISTNRSIRAAFLSLPIIIVMRLTVSWDISSSGKLGKLLLSKGRHWCQNSAISVQEVLPCIAARRMTQKTISNG